MCKQVGQKAISDEKAVDSLHKCLLRSAKRLYSNIPLASTNKMAEEVIGENFSAIVEFVPDYEHAAAQCSNVDLLSDPVKADLAGQNGKDAVQVRLQSSNGSRSDCYVVMCLDKASQRIDRPHPLRKLTGGYVQESELKAKVVIDNRENSSEDRMRFLERAGPEPVILWLDGSWVRHPTHFQQDLQSNSAWSLRSLPVKPVRPLPFDELYQLCEKNLPELFYIGGYPFCRNLQKYSSSGNEFEAGERGEETDFVRVSYAGIASNGEAADVASDLVCAVDGLPDFPRIIQDIKRTAEAAISGNCREIQRLNLPPTAGPRMVPLEPTAPREDLAREGSRPNDALSMGSYQDLLSPPHIFTTGVVRRSRTIYWSVNQPPGDTKAQLIVALIQLRLLGDPSPFVRWLERYTLQQFKIMAPWRYRTAVAQDTVSRILSLHGLNEDYRSWRKYVRFYLNLVTREHFPNSPEVPEADTYPSEEEFRTSFGPIQAGSWSVGDCARELGVSRQRVNKLIRKLICEGKLIPVHTKPLRIAEAHVDMLVAGRRRRLLEQHSRLRTRKKLEQHGKSVEAARKAINRKLGRLPSFFQGAS